MHDSVAVLIVVYGIVHFSPPNASTISAGIAVGALARAIDSSRSGGL